MCARTIAGNVNTFGTTGYTKDRVFVLYDRATESVWYPLSDDTFDAISGSHKGASLPFVEEPDPIPLSEWVQRHPDTLVLLPDRVGRSQRSPGFLGVQFDPVEPAVVEVIPQTGAAMAGLEADDRILRFGGTKVTKRAQITEILRQTKPGEKLDVKIQRAGAELELTVTLGERPQQGLGSFGIAGREAPAWRVDEWVGREVGEPRPDVSDFRGKTVCLMSLDIGGDDFSERLSGIARLLETFKEDESVVVAIMNTHFEAHESDKDLVASRYQALRRHGLELPMGNVAALPGKKQPYVESYRIGDVPWGVVIDREGVVRFNDFGCRPEVLLEEVRKQMTTKRKSARL